MPAAPIPPAFDRLAGRRFSFYPPILKTDSNEWTFRHATWSEILVRCQSGADISIPRRFVGDVSGLDDSNVIVTLLEQLEFRDGLVWPQRCRVIELPLPLVESSRPRRENRQPAAVVNIRLEARTDSRAGRFAGGAVALGVLGCLAVVGYSLQDGDPHRRAVVASLDQPYLGLTPRDTYPKVVRALGIPDSDRWVTTSAGDRLRVLDYRGRGFQAVLAPETSGVERYIGAVDERGRILQGGAPLRGLESY